MNKETLLRKNNIMVNELKKDRPLLLENILRSIDEYAEYYHQSKVKKLNTSIVRKRSELLKAFIEYHDTDDVFGDCDNDCISGFLKAFYSC